MSFNWSQACDTQSSRPLSQMQEENYGGCLFAAASFAAAALYSGKWFRHFSKKGVQNKMWPLLGRYCGVLCCGSVFGACAWSSYSQANTLWFESLSPLITVNLNDRQNYIMFSRSWPYYTAFYFFYALEFLCFIVLKLMLLERLARIAVRSAGAGPEASRDTVGSGSSHPLMKTFRVMAAAVVLCGGVSLVSFMVSCAYESQVSGLYVQAATACDAEGNDTNSSIYLAGLADAANDNCNKAQAVQNMSESIAIVIISIAYAVVVIYSIKMFRRAESAATFHLNNINSSGRGGKLNSADAQIVDVMEDTIDASAELRKRLLSACIVVMITFPARAAFDFLNAYGALNQEINSSCGQCDPCQSDQGLIGLWINFTPEFWAIVVALSSPLPLALGLWIVTRAHSRQMKIAGDVQRLTAFAQSRSS